MVLVKNRYILSNMSNDTIFLYINVSFMVLFYWFVTLLIYFFHSGFHSEFSLVLHFILQGKILLSVHL